MRRAGRVGYTLGHPCPPLSRGGFAQHHFGVHPELQMWLTNRVGFALRHAVDWRMHYAGQDGMPLADTT